MRKKNDQQLNDKSTAPKKKAGRPAIPIDKNKLEVLAKYLATEADIAKFFNCEKSAISRFVKKEYGCDFPDFRKAQHINFKYQMINKVVKYVNNNLEDAINGKGRINNQMLIFLMKNLCDWKDKVETTTAVDPSGGTPIINFGIERRVETIDVEAN